MIVSKNQSKTITNRLKGYLDLIVSKTQSAFIPNRLISDNIIIGYEFLYKIRCKKGCNEGFAALKLDMSKVYNRFFLQEAIERQGFSNELFKLIMKWITTTFFSILINRIPKGTIQPQRGLKQGCLRSLYILIHNVC